MSTQVIAAALDPVAAPPPELVDALQSHLGSLAALVRTLNEAVYQATPSRTSGSIGEHVRHCLDHAKAVTASLETPMITYDSRHRGTSIERQPSIAIGEIERVCRQLDALDEFALERRITLDTMTHRDAPPTRVETTIGREVVFAIQHTIHHCALVAMLLDRLGQDVPTRFGYAPSTPSRR